jgi:hypothetical protein
MSAGRTHQDSSECLQLAAHIVALARTRQHIRVLDIDVSKCTAEVADSIRALEEIVIPGHLCTWYKTNLVLPFPLILLPAHWVIYNQLDSLLCLVKREHEHGTHEMTNNINTSCDNFETRAGAKWL